MSRFYDNVGRCELEKFVVSSAQTLMSAWREDVYRSRVPHVRTQPVPLCANATQATGSLVISAPAKVCSRFILLCARYKLKTLISTDERL